MTEINLDFENLKFPFFLDNKMGMKEKIEDLFLIDFVLKDRDKIIIRFSGYINLVPDQ